MRPCGLESFAHQAVQRLAVDFVAILPLEFQHPFLLEVVLVGGNGCPAALVERFGRGRHVFLDVDEDDLVVLAQALTYGKGLQKALLIVRRLRAEFASQNESRLNLETIELYDELNEREKEVAGYIASGFNSKEIAQMLNVTTQYIYNVRSRIREKIGVPDQQDLLNYLRASTHAPVAAPGGEASPRKASAQAP